MSALQEEIKQAISEVVGPLLREEISSLVKEAIAEAMHKPEDDLISLSDAAAKLGVHTATLCRWRDEGRYKATRVGRSIFFNRSEIFTNNDHK